MQENSKENLVNLNKLSPKSIELLMENIDNRLNSYVD